MKQIPSNILNTLNQDWQLREEVLRNVVEERLAASPPPAFDDQIVVTYFLALRSQTLNGWGKDFGYFATSGIKDPPPGSLIEECTGKGVGVDAFDASGQTGMVHVTIPLKMILQPDGHLTSTDILHATCNAIVCDVYENVDARLVRITIPERVIESFPGPAYGPAALRAANGFAPTDAVFGTILKPTAGILPVDVGAMVEEAARCPLFLFVKEDENLFPHLDYSPVVERTRAAVEGIQRAAGERGTKGLIFAPHITGSPNEILDTVLAVLEAGATGVMFSETFSGGTVRMVREATRDHERPPAIYGHNAGLGMKTRSVWREVVDLLARLDGIDFRQTAPVLHGDPFIRPYGAEWEASEKALTMPLGSIKPTMITRAGGLDQGNLIMNLQDAEERGLTESILFLAGSAINSIKNREGKADPRYGAEAMRQAINVHHAGDLNGTPPADHVRILLELARNKSLTALADALEQRYPELAS
jgi:ribulose 1,5-bisphosphate carboxylase large subunit-like protein